MVKKENKEKKKIKWIFIIIAIILIIISLVINRNIFIRPLLFIIAVVIIALVNTVGRKDKILTFMISFVIGFVISLIIDSVYVMTFKSIPVFSYNIITYDNIKVYNGIGVRVWQCDKDSYKNLIVDPFYKKGYMCDVTDTDAMDINSFLNSVVENYDSYKNNYIKIDGKISKKMSRNLIEMQPYEKSSITVNGYVTFADNIVLRVLFKEEEPTLDDYDIYDDIVIVGIIKNMEHEGDKYVIYMDDSKVVSDIDLKEYTLSVTPSKSCTNKRLQFQSDSLNIYTYCIDDMIINFGEKKYELSTALSSGKLNISELYEYPDKEESNEEGDKLYYNDMYNVKVCNTETSKDIIIGSGDMKFDDVPCERKETE